MSNLIPLESVNAIELFTGGGLQQLLDDIQKEATDFEPDLSTDKGRKKIASQAMKVRRSKVVIDDAGKVTVADWKAKAKVIDAGRKKARDFLDHLADEIRQPLTELEQQEKAKALLDVAHIEALDMHTIWLREQEVLRKEADLMAAQVERDRIEQEFAETQRKEEEKNQLKAEAQAQAKRDFAAAIELERDRANQVEQQAEQARLKAVQDQAVAVKAERQRILTIEAERKAATDRQAAIDAAAETKRQADITHRKAVNNAALAALIENGITEKAGKEFITLVYVNKIPGMKMVY